ncbi:MAG: phenylacetate-CoA oxygenase subunit PaaI [Planctomycetes bacterium]|nr:phenylacetate-CoA oxygenase subunit PaaI [Planctomycetota bacterium]NUQ33437.1 phenylacetate-CoA oxygenase subunit PaaI [Planctomycetaceae bacterium]
MMISKRIRTMDDWVDMFHSWQEDIGLDLPEVKKYQFTELYDTDATTGTEIEFGDFAGNKKWNSVLEVPTQNIRDTLLQLTYVQGDTEFASVEQQRLLVNNAPHEYDRYALVRIMIEEMRHGWQMCDVLVRYFGDSGKVEARKLLERRASEAFPGSKGGKRLLGSFNQAVNNWVDFYSYTCFVDRDGKYQLGMLAPSAFAPLARSAGPMLREEAFHLGSGQDGLKRIILGNRLPIPLLQKYVNKWVSTAHDLFGKDGSSTAEWGYVWGLKGRFDEREQKDKTNFDRKTLNDHNRTLYHNEVAEILRKLNIHIEETGRKEKLVMPHLKFRREIGDWAGGQFDIHGNEIKDKAAYDQYLRDNMPSEHDEAKAADIAKDNAWIQDKKLPPNAWDFKPMTTR